MNSIKQRMKNIKSEPFFFQVNKQKYKQTNKEANSGYEQFRNEIKTIEKSTFSGDVSAYIHGKEQRLRHFYVN